MKINKTIVLVGLMGAGKSTVGQRLAERLELEFVDVDSEAEKREGLTVSEIFKQKGEKYFRQLELKIIDEKLSGKPHVLATGGGAFINDDIRKLVKEKATSVWLRAGLDMLLERVSRNDARPLLQGGDRKEVLERLLKERNPIYAEADLIVDSDQGPHYKVVDQIIWKL